MGLFGQARQEKAEAREIQNLTELAGYSIENAAEVHVERAKHMLREAGAIEHSQLLAREDFRGMLIAFYTEVVDQVSRMKQKVENGEMELPGLSKLEEVADKIDTGYKALDDLTDDELRIYSATQKAFKEMEQDSQSEYWQTGEYLSSLDGMKKLLEELESEDSKVLVKLAFELFDASEKQNQERHPLGTFKKRAPILMIQRAVTWTNIKPDLQRAVSALSEYRTTLRRRSALAENILTAGLSQLDEASFSVELDLSKKAKNEATKLLFPTRDEYSQFFADYREGFNEWSEQAEAALQRGPITRFMAPMIFGSHMKTFMKVSRELSQSMEEETLDEIYGEEH